MKILPYYDAINFDLHKEEIQSKKIILHAGEQTRLQNHHDTEFWIIHSGEAVLYTVQSRFAICSNMQVYFDPFDDHFLKNNSTEDFVFTAYWYVCVDEQFLENELGLEKHLE